MDSAILLDSYGRKLVDELQANARLSVAELSRRIGLSATAVTERLKQMEESGIIESYAAQIDREALGLEVMAFIRMSCAGQSYHRLIDYLQSLEEVRECHHLTGGDDLLLKVTTHDMAHLEALIEALLPYGTPTTSLVLSSPVPHRPYAASGKLATVAPKTRQLRRFQRG
ncbi:Lrp/AsnC family transcriptional regulator [Telmatobacter bradus]|jgi:Lrp/AsnC family leucine-responsive transcriptional regulator|uniref:Lrp/AsnC family transcriptional regulator n=1 Tax=Telmatobacter bradus TaxID=474953 RepID=UPI003B431165